MREICKYCDYKDKCSYVKCDKANDCIDVQTSDYGYEEAINNVCDWLREHWREYIDTDRDGMIRFAGWEKDLRDAMDRLC